MIKQTVKIYEIINLFINKLSQNCNYIQTRCVTNGIHIIIHNVIWYNNTCSNICMNNYSYTYMYSNTNNNIIIIILV